MNQWGLNSKSTICSQLNDYDVKQITKQTQLATVFFIVLFSYSIAREGLIRPQTDNHASLFFNFFFFH
jgi:hypothetical protein